MIALDNYKESAVLNSDYLTSLFEPSRGMREGYLLIANYFALAAKILSNNIRQGTNIKEISILGNNRGQNVDKANLFCY